MLPVWIGLMGVIASFVVWVATGHVSPVLLGAFGTMIAGGQGVELIATLRQGPSRGEN